MTKPRAAIVYARVSSEKQGRDKAVSIGEQVSACLARLRANGDKHVATYIDDKRYVSEFSGRLVEPSAKRSDRPEWKKMLAGAGREYTVIYAWRADRLCRGNESTGVFERYLDETKIDVELVTQRFDRDSFGLLSGGVGGFELRSINARMIMGREGRIRSGLHVGRSPQGYAAVRSEQGKNIGYALTDAGRVFLSALAAMFLEGLPLNEIGRRLGPSPKTGRAYSTSTVVMWLRSPFYRAVLSYGRGRPAEQIVYNERPAQHEPAWDSATIAAIDAELERRRILGRRRARRRTHDHLLAGVLHCGYCGLPLIKTTNGWGGRVYLSYVCNPRRRASLGCPANSISETVAIRLLRAEWASIDPSAIDTYLDSQFSMPAAPIASVAMQASVDQLEAEAAELEGDRAGASAASARLIDRRLAEVRADIAARQVDRSARLAEAAHVTRAALRDAMLRIVELAGVWDQLSRAQQKAAIAQHPPVYIKHGQITAAPPTL